MSAASTAIQINPKNNNNHYAEFIRYDGDIEPITHMEMIKETIEMEKRARRTPQSKEFDRGYDEFLRNYRNDRPHNNYKVRESDEAESESDDDDEGDNNDDDSGSDEDNESGEESTESEEQPKAKKRYSKVSNNSKNGGKNSVKNSANHPKHKDDSDEDYERVKQESNKNNKKTKYCKMEKRGNMLCSVCHNPKTDEKSESCKFNSDPKDKMYAYSNEKKYSSADGDKNRESFEDVREFTTRRPPPNQQRINNNNWTPYHPSLQHQNQHNCRRPMPQPQFAYIRLRNSPGPVRSQRIRIINIPPPSQQYHRPPQQRQFLQQYQQPPLPPSPYYQRPYPIYGQESRPHRDVINYESNLGLRIENKTNEYDLLPAYSKDKVDREYDEFIAKDWSNCRKFVEDQHLCYECAEENGTNKQCMFVSKANPENLAKSYSKANNHEHNVNVPKQRHRTAKIHPAWRIEAEILEKKKQNQTKNVE